MENKNIALVVGATGITGSNLAQELITQGWTAYGLSRNPNNVIESLRPVQADLLNIDAIEETGLLMIAREDYENLTVKIPLMDRYFRILYQNSLVTKDYRLMVSNSFTAEEKYTQFARKNPDIIQRIPHNLIASYLGLAPETVSRIRKKISFK